MFEKQLKELNPQLRNITYEINDLQKYIDNFPDISVLVYEPQIQAYKPFSKDWIKRKVYQILRNQASWYQWYGNSKEDYHTLFSDWPFFVCSEIKL